MHSFKNQTDLAKSDRTNKQPRSRLEMDRVMLRELRTKLLD